MARTGALWALAAAIAAVLLGLAGPSAAAPSILYVAPAPTGSDASPCSKAQPCATIDHAISVAAAGDTVAVAAGTYIPPDSSTAVANVTKNVTLEGGWDGAFTAQSGRSTLDGHPDNSVGNRGVDVPAGVTATLHRFVVQNGVTVNTINGGGIRNAGTLTVSDSIVQGNIGNEGAGIANGGTLTLLRSTVENQSSPSGTGAGLYAYYGSSARIVESTFELNHALRGGAIYIAQNGSVALVNSTIATNKSEWGGGGIYVENGATLQVSSSAIVSNQAALSASEGGGGILAGTGTPAVTLRDTIIAGNTAASSIGTADCGPVGGSIVSAGYNLIADTSGCPIARTTGDLFNVDAALDPALKNNGGPTDTEALLPQSPAIDGGNPAGCRDDLGTLLTTDQRGLPRSPAGDDCDIGPFEVQIPTNDTFAAATVLAPAGGTLTGTNNTASKQVGEPDHAGDEGGASVWFDWTAPNANPVSFSTDGSAFDTLLAAYTGASVANLTRVASNDDIGSGTGPSRICFTPTSGTTYHIAVDGYAGDGGAYTLAWGAKSDGAPCPTLPPTISSTTPHVGDTLTSDAGTWVGQAAASRQWYRCYEVGCDAITGATGAIYVVQARDVGEALTVEVTEGGASSQSDPTAVVTKAAGPSAANGRVFWTSNRDGLDFEIYSMLPDGTSLQRLTNRAGFDTEPVPSPDGTRVAYIRDGKLAVMNADGSDVQSTGLDAAFPVWSPDGSRIAFTHPSGGQFDGIDIVAVDGSSHVELLHDAPGTFDDLAWSPDGSTIAFTYRDGGDFDIFTMRADGRGPITNLTSASGADDHSPAYSPDGTKLLFVRGPLVGSLTDGDLYVMNADGSNQQVRFDGDAQHIVTTAAWSPNGQTILFSEFDNGNSDLYTIPAGGGAKTPLVSHLDRDELPAWGAPATFPLSIATGGAGTVSCSPACASSYADGASVQLTPSAASGWTFAGWSGACSGTGACVVTMLGARSVTASFTQNPPPSSGGGGGGGGGSSGIPPDIHVDVSASAAVPPPVGSDLVFVVTVSTRNTGGSSDVRLELTLPAGWTYDHSYADRGPGCVGSAPKLTCDVAFINPSSWTHVQLFGKVASAGDLSLTATATSQQEPEFDARDNTVTLTLSAPVPVPTPVPPAPKPKPVPQVAPPVLSGSARVGATLHAAAAAGAHLQWQLCTPARCTPIKGATKATLKLLKAYAGKSVRVVETLNGKAVASKKLAVKGRAASR